MKLKIIFIIIIFNISPKVHAKLKNKKSLTPYGKFGVMAYTKDNDTSIENVGSRIGIKAKTLIKELSIIAYARGEWSFNAVENTADLSIGANNNVVSDSVSQNTFRRRLGFIGFKSPSFGDIRFGKQWSVYSDVSHFTDSFNLFGGSSSGTYNLNTDGGQSGTGRVSKGITYRKKINKTKLGFQVKLIQNKYLSIQGSETTLKAKDAFGASIKHLFSELFEIGFAYNQIDLKGEKDAVKGYDGKNSYSAILGFKFFMKDSLIALTFNKSKNHEMDSDNEIFEAKGFEAYSSHDLNKQLSIYAGFNELLPSDNNYKKKYIIRDYIVGSQYNLKDLKFFIEGKLSSSMDANGVASKNSIGLGAVFKF